MSGGYEIPTSKGRCADCGRWLHRELGTDRWACAWCEKEALRSERRNRSQAWTAEDRR